MAAPLDWLNADVAQLRADYEWQRARPMPENARWLTVDAVRVLEHRVAQVRAGAIVYFHGGGFIVGSPLTHADVTAQLGRATGLPLYSVDYRLAPDFVAPAPVEDGRAVIDHLLAKGATRLVVCGDSAGGAIALAVEASLPAAVRGHLAGVCSFYGAHGLLDTPSIVERGRRAEGTDAACLRRYFDLATGGTAENPYAIGALARRSSVPAYLMVGSDDPLRDDTLGLAQALAGMGRDVTLDVAPGEGHGLLHIVESSRAAADALERAARWIEGRCCEP